MISPGVRLTSKEAGQVFPLCKRERESSQWLLLISCDPAWYIKKFRKIFQTGNEDFPILAPKSKELRCCHPYYPHKKKAKQTEINNFLHPLGNWSCQGKSHSRVWRGRWIQSWSQHLLTRTGGGSRGREEICLPRAMTLEPGADRNV